MRQLRPVVSFFLVLAFSLIALGDLTGHSRPGACSDQEGDCQVSSSVVAEAGTHGVHSEGSPCADPCHYGLSHFGHSSILIVSGIGAVAPSIETMIGLSRPSSPIASPFLEGLRRPPRRT